jgi:hypothetical protein
MNPDALVLALLAIVDLTVIVHLRQRHARRLQMDRVMTSLCMAVRRENDVEALPPKNPLLHVS